MLKESSLSYPTSLFPLPELSWSIRRVIGRLFNETSTKTTLITSKNDFISEKTGERERKGDVKIEWYNLLAFVASGFPFGLFGLFKYLAL